MIYTAGVLQTDIHFISVTFGVAVENKQCNIYS